MASGGASKSFSIQAEYKFSVARLQVLSTGQTVPRVAPGRVAGEARTTISRVIVLHSDGALTRTSLACHFPATGDAISVNQ